MVAEPQICENFQLSHYAVFCTLRVISVKVAMFIVLADGEDFVGGIFTITLSAGMTQSCLPISIIDDSAMEDEIETFLVFLSNVDPGVDSSTSQATVQILDDDGKCVCIYIYNIAIP